MSGGRRSIFWRLRRLWFLLGLLAIGSVSGVGFVLAQVPLPTTELPVETTFLYDTDGNKLAELSGGENRVSVPLEQVSKRLVDAVLAAEDRDFFQHPGVDLSAIARATVADLRGRPLQGGSTITQQYVKNTYVGDERSITRKLKEAVLAVKLERKLEKPEILERYLNAVYFGRGAYGAQAAAKAYFNTSVDRLQVRQAAYLAGLIRAPEAADATSDPDEADRRRDLVLGAMRDEDLLTEDEVRRAREQRVQEYARPRADVRHDRYVAEASGTPYIVEHARRRLQELGFTDGQINGGGLRVTTSIDLELQEAAHRAVYAETLDQEGDPAGALVAVDTDGRVRAMVGGRDWDANEPWARVNFATGATGGGTGRQAGSAFKPFALAAAVAEGYTVESAFESPQSLVFPKANNGVDYKVSNYEKRAHGTVNLIEATKVSSNTVYAQLVEALGAERVAAMATRLGITTEVPPVLSVSLGTSVVSVLDMASSYATLAARGARVAPDVIERVTDAEGRVLFERQATREQVLEPAHADIVTSVLRGVLASGGTGARASLPVPAAGKTGTTQSNGDAWFVGYTPGLSTAVWMGYPEGQKREMDDVHGIAVTGGTLPAEAWRRFMEVATRNPRYAGRFAAPKELGAGRVLRGSARVSSSSTTTTTSSTTSTTAPEDESSTTTTSGPSTTTTAPRPSPSSTSTTAPSTTTTTTAPPTTTSTSPPPSTLLR